MSWCPCVSRCLIRFQAAFGIGDAASKKSDEEEEKKGLLDRMGMFHTVKARRTSIASRTLTSHKHTQRRTKLEHIRIIQQHHQRQRFNPKHVFENL